MQQNRSRATFVQNLSVISWLCAGLLVLVGPSSAAGPAKACDNPDVVRFSLVPEQGVDRQMDAYLPLVKVLEEKIGRRIEVVRPTSYASVVDGLVNARLDLAVLGPASYVAARRRDPGIVPFASHAKAGGAFHEPGNAYRAVLIVRAAAGIEAIDGLRGRRLALTDPGSTSGALLPRQAFRRDEASRLGLPFDRFFGSVIYAGDHRRAALAVIDSQVDAAYVSNDILSSLVREGKLKPEAIKLLWQSAPIHRDPYVYRELLCEPLKKKIRDAFLGIHDQGASPVLARIGVERFVPVSDVEYQSIASVFDELSR